MKYNDKKQEKDAEKCPSFYQSQDGNVLLYILIAIALFAMLTFAFVDDNGENLSKQNYYKMSEELLGQFSTINSAIMSCIIEYPEGGGDLDGNTQIEAADNDNRPYPLTPSDTNNPGGGAANDDVRGMECPGSGLGIFTGAGNTGNYLPPPPSGFSEWELFNDTNGVRLVITGSGASGLETVAKLQNKFDSCQTDLDYGSCGAACISIWIKKNAGCP